MTDNSQPKPKIIVTDSTPPARCSRCHKDIATVIVACTPDNMRPHPVTIPTAYYTDDRRQPVCSDCFAAYERREREFQAIKQRLGREGQDKVTRPASPRQGKSARSSSTHRSRKSRKPEPALV